ncbi:MAG: Heavy-metal resistance [Anaerophaga sp.]|nr:Heavy-metal resistance [Anaerophaga sp.]
MSKKTTIATFLILVTAFAAGWGIYKWVNPISGQDVTISGQDVTYTDTSSANNITPGPGFRQMVNILDFSEEQARTFSRIEALYRQQMAEYTAQLDSIDLAILEEVKKEKPDREKLDSLAARAGEIQYALKKATGEHFLQVRDLCTPEQQKRFMQIISDLDRYRRGRGFGNGPGQGRGKRGQRRGWRNR